ncbi:MAG: prolipoprotein diacylglyceryl transferase family protein [Robiginitomaculum sp.]
MHPHIFFDLLAWGLAFGAGFLALRMAGGPRDKSLYGPAYYGALAGGAIAGAFGFGSLNLMLGGHEVAIGRSVVGALAGAIIAIEIYKKLKGVRGSTGVTFVAAFAVGIAIGRIGCFLSGLEDYTYGVETALSWGVDFGDGISRHPVQLYEALSMGGFAVLYFISLRLKKNWATCNAFYIMVLVYAGQRFVWEFLKPYTGIIGPFNIFHLVTAGLIGYAVYMLAKPVAENKGL